MRVFAIEGGFGLENLKLVERPDPEPGPGQVLVKVRACSLNYRDLLMVRGMYNPKQPLPLVPLSDGAGEVVAVGAGVKRAKVGDRIAGCFVQDWIAGAPTKAIGKTTLGGPLDGMLAEQVLLPDHGFVHIPEHLSWTEAATLPCAALTAWSALVVNGRVGPGQTVLVQGTGGVSIFALQFAKMLGANAIVTSSSDEKLTRATHLGATHTINYRATPKWGAAARELSGGEGVDLVVEVGGAQTLPQSLSAIRPGGEISLIGILSGVSTEIPLTSILMRNVRVQGVLVGHRDGFEQMVRAIAQHQMFPVVDRVFGFADAPAALEYLGTGSHFGKVCIEVP